MKIVLLLLIAALSACKSKPRPAPAASRAPLVDTFSIGAVNSRQGNSAQLFIGLAAQWKRTATERIDGSYDTVGLVFVPCGRQKGMTVAREAIDLLPGAGCDEASHHIQLMLMRKDSILLLPTLTSLDSTRPHTIATFKGRDSLQTGVILLDEASIRRIRLNKQLTLPVLQKKK